MNDETRAAEERVRRINAGETLWVVYDGSADRALMVQADRRLLVDAYLANPPRELKPLVWEEDDELLHCYADTPFGRYRCTEMGWDLIDSRGRQISGWSDGTGRPRSEVTLLCEADYSRRVDELYVPREGE